MAEKKGFVINGNLKPNVKAGEVMNWLKEDFKLGRGHALSIYHSFKAEETAHSSPYA